VNILRRRAPLKGMLLGIYEIKHKHWMMDGAPWDYGVELLQEDIDPISDKLALSFKRYPCPADGGRAQVGEWRLHI
jgi:dimethylglycine dehydrogenase